MRGTSIKQAGNLCILLLLFLGYTLTFLVPKFYGMTDAYVGVFVFFCLSVLLLLNAQPFVRLKNLETDLLLLIGLLLLSGINLLLVDSGKGAFFVLADFLLLFYLADKISLTRAHVLLLSAAYLVMLFVWLLAVYPKMFAAYGFYGYNTNTAATFTSFTLLCAFLFVQFLQEKYRIAGLLAVILIVKGIQLSLYHRARGALVCLLLFLLFYYIVPRRILLKQTVFYLIFTMATLGSLLFVAAYTFLGNTGFNYQLPIFYKEIFSGREKIWAELFAMLVKKPLTGIGTNVSITSFFEFNVHNAMYNILVVYGVVTFAGVMVFLFRRMAVFRKRSEADRLAHCALCVVLAIFFESFFDVDLLWADYALNLLFLLCMVSSAGGEAERTAHGEV